MRILNLFILAWLIPAVAFGSTVSNEMMVAYGGAAVATCANPGDITTNTKLLIHSNNPDGSTAIIDSSPSSRKLTVLGAANHDDAQAHFGNSAVLVGADNTVSALDSADFTVGSGDWTVEFWFRLISNGGIPEIQYIFGQANSAATASVTSFFGYIDVTDVMACAVNLTVPERRTATSTGTITDQTWHHYACNRDGDTLRLYIDGVQDGTANLSTGKTVNDSTAIFKVGGVGDYTGGGPGAEFEGHIDEFIYTKGVALYPDGTTFTPPTAPYSSTCFELDGYSARIPFSVSAHSAGDDLTIVANDAGLMTWACGTHDTDDLRQNIFIARDSADGYTGELYETPDGSVDCITDADFTFEFDASTTDTDYYLYYDGPFNSEWYASLTGGAAGETFGTPVTDAVPLFRKVSNGSYFTDHFADETNWSESLTGDATQTIVEVEGFSSIRHASASTGTRASDYDFGTVDTNDPLVCSMRINAPAFYSTVGGSYFFFAINANSVEPIIALADDGLWTHTGAAWTRFYPVVLTIDVWHDFAMDCDLSVAASATCDVYWDGVKIIDDTDVSYTSGLHCTSGCFLFRSAGSGEAVDLNIDNLSCGNGFINE